MEGDELRDLRASVTEVLADLASSARVHAAIDDGRAVDAHLWQAIAELGWVGAGVPEGLGGAGLGVAAACMIAEELGYRAAPVPFISSAVLATSALAEGDSDALRERWLPRLADGSARGTVVDPSATLEWRGDGRRDEVSGTIELVLDAAEAELLIAPARDRDGRCAWFLIERGELDARPVPLHDLTRAACEVEVHASPARERLIAGPDRAQAFSARMSDLAACALAADSLGGIRHVTDLTVEYVKARRQFGHPIGAFQAVKQQCTDMYIDLVATETAAADAVRTQPEGGVEAALAASVAKSQATERYVRAAGTAMQLHGGIGFSWEHDVHVHLRRAMANDALFGSREWHRDRIAALMSRTRFYPEAVPA